MNKKIKLGIAVLVLVSPLAFYRGRPKVQAELSVREVNMLTGFSPHTAKAVCDMYGKRVPPSVIMAQAILESGWGESKSARKNLSFFGWKASNDWDGPVGKNGDGTCRKYASATESYVDHVRSLSTYPRYSKCFDIKGLTKKSISHKWVECLEDSGYCRGDYAKKLKRIINQYKLYQHD